MSGKRSVLAVCGLVVLLIAAGSAIASRIRPRPDASGIVFTRHDGTTFSFPDALVRCGPSDEGGGRRAIKVSSVPAPDDPLGSYFKVEAILADVASHPTVRFPDVYLFGNPEGAFIFVYDKENPHVAGGNEASSAQEEAKGNIVFHKARCRPRPRVSFTVHAMLGSEFFGVRRVSIDGTFHGHR